MAILKLKIAQRLCLLPRNNDAEEIVKKHIELLHSYNEIK